MSNRTMLAIGQNTLSVPRVVKRAVQVAIATGLTAAVSLIIVVTNSFLLARSSSLQGLDVWLAFIKRSDIIGTIVLTALVTLAYLSWQRDRDKR